MKKLLLFGYLLLASIGLQAQTVGIKITTPIIRNNPIDNTITGYADLLNGGYHIGINTASRDSLSTYYTTTLHPGMLFYCISNNTTYIWDGTLWNTVINNPTLQQVLTSGNTATIGASITNLILTGTNNGYVFLPTETGSNPTFSTAGHGLYTGIDGHFAIAKNGGVAGEFSLQALTATRIFAFPDISGTVALNSSVNATVTNANLTIVNGIITAAANGSGGGVTSVTASGNIASSGGSTPNITFTGILPVANGGTGTATPGLTAGTNIAITGTWPFQTINASGGLATTNFVYNEVPSGTINGTNVTFTLANTPTTGKIQLTKNGQTLAPTTDYTISSGTITYAVPPTTVGGTDVLMAFYLK